MNSNMNITINGITEQFSKGITGLELSKYYKDKYDRDILAFKMDNQLMTLDKKINKDCNIEFVDYMQREGNKMYVNGLKLLLLISIKEVIGMNADINFEHSIDKGIYCKIISDKIISDTQFDDIHNKMKELVDMDLQIETVSVTKSDLIKFYKSTKQYEKINNLKTKTGELVQLSKCKNHYAYFYGELPLTTGVFKKFDLTKLENNIMILRFPIIRGKDEVPDYQHHTKIISVFEEYEKWIDIMGVRYLGDINNIVSDGKIDSFIRMNEYIQNKQLTDIVDNISKNIHNVKIILIAGPSSSGKTTTAHKLCMYLKTKGLRPHVLSTDDYFVDRKDTPLDLNGEPDFESINAIDLQLFNDQLTKLIDGQTVSTPTYNFIKGEKEFNSRILKLEEKDILVIEGLHTLNEELTSSIPKDKKTKIYISPFTPLGIDRYNHISTTDIRLLRRIVRDNRTRGHNVIDTLKGWNKVRAGEEIYVFPYQDEADYVFNTALIYEIGILKVYVEPLLFGVDIDSPYYEEARRLIKFLRMFFPIPSEDVPYDSLLREFIGGSCFYD